jgi:hypothetical protein
MGAVWTTPAAQGAANKNARPRIESGHFLVDSHGIVAENATNAKPMPKHESSKNASTATALSRGQAQLAAAAPLRQKEP